MNRAKIHINDLPPLTRAVFSWDAGYFYVDSLIYVIKYYNKYTDEIEQELMPFLFGCEDG